MALTSVLDTDLYKLTMQQAVLEHYPAAVVSYKFTNRAGSKFTRRAFTKIGERVAALAELSLTAEELAWLTKTCDFFTPKYLAYLEAFRFDPENQVQLSFVPLSGAEANKDGEEWGALEVAVKGVWAETILYEVPLMAIISETYFDTVDTKWDYQGQIALAASKASQMLSNGCFLAEFGTRRRRSYLGHDLVMQGLTSFASSPAAQALPGKLTGTSNVHFAMKYGIRPIGTIAHEWIMAVAAVEGYQGANGKALDLWDLTYPAGTLTIALTDTFSTAPFFVDFLSKPARARRWKGLRQDSGDAFAFIKAAKKVWVEVGADPKEKVIVFSDGLDVDRALKLKQACDEEGVGCSFGVGTFFTNNYKVVAEKNGKLEPGEGEIITEGPTSKALNMVIKLYSINDIPCVKISDDLTKNSGDAQAVKKVKEIFGLEAGGKVPEYTKH